MFFFKSVRWTQRTVDPQQALFEDNSTFYCSLLLSFIYNKKGTRNMKKTNRKQISTKVNKKQRERTKMP